ncbi:hypothetical protein PFISCL1PPCAC_16182, partial [Pristionchus fissidentatus]
QNQSMDSKIVKFKIAEISKFTNLNHSSVKFVDGLPICFTLLRESCPWNCEEFDSSDNRIAFHSPIDSTHSSLLLLVNGGSDCRMWRAEIEASLIVINEEPEKNIRYTMNCTFSRKDGVRKFALEVSMFSSERGFIKDDRLELQLVITKKSILGILKPLEFDFSAPGVGSDDVKLIIEGEKVHVSKNYISMHSP